MCIRQPLAASTSTCHQDAIWTTQADGPNLTFASSAPGSADKASPRPASPAAATAVPGGGTSARKRAPQLTAAAPGLGHQAVRGSADSHCGGQPSAGVLPTSVRQMHLRTTRMFKKENMQSCAAGRVFSTVVLLLLPSWHFSAYFSYCIMAPQGRKQPVVLVCVAVPICGFPSFPCLVIGSAVWRYVWCRSLHQACGVIQPCNFQRLST